ncbi:MAG: Maf-like protein [Candidatus Azobacteroides sp.]|nr:Maf-like protein [Candidatus Azobacteroides sp.]
MLENLSEYKIILASNSPRRKELLSGLDLDYEIKTLPDVDENYPSHLKGTEIPEFISLRKVEAYFPFMDDRTLIITADTIVWLDGKVYGKPQDKKDAKNMLRALSGKTHEVITGVCLTTLSRQKVFSAVSEVSFASLEEQEIEYYVEKYLPMDKAGAYGVQEWIGYIGVENMKGSYFNVMGLPVQRLYRELIKW